MLKALVVEEMLEAILTDNALTFRLRCDKLCLTLGAKDKRTTSRIVDNYTFFARWENVPPRTVRIASSLSVQPGQPVCHAMSSLIY